MNLRFMIGIRRSPNEPAHSIIIPADGSYIDNGAEQAVYA